VAEALRAEVEALAVAHPATPRGVVTISLGVATTMPTDETCPRDLLAAADRALYEAKRAGRNCVQVAPEVPSGAAAPDDGPAPD
jgi:diguanylate cyclase (GGDEF)-like protein